MLIGTVAKKSGLTRDTVRFYERSGLISSSNKQAGTRMYSDYAPDVIDRLIAIKQAQSAGFTLREIKQILDEWGGDADTVPRHEIIRLLEAKIQQTDEKLRHLQQVRQYLVAKVERLRTESQIQDASPI